MNLSSLKYDLKSITKELPDLEVFCKGGIPYKLEGPIEILDIEGNSRGMFDIRITFDACRYPNTFPVLREISMKIPRIRDRHIYDDTGDCCVTVPQKACIERSKGITISDYVKKYAVPYLANQIYYEENGKWANGDYKHGKLGKLQFYVETFNTTDLDFILACVGIAVNRTVIKRKLACFCGSGKPFKKCHEVLIEEIRKIGSHQLAEDRKMITEINVLIKANENKN